MAPVRLFVLGSDELFAEGLSALWGADPSVELVGKTTDPQEAVEACGRLRPDVALVDVGYIAGETAGELAGGESGVHRRLRVIRELAEGLNVRVLAASGVVDDWIAVSVMMSGALGIIGRSSSLEEMLEGVRRVSRGQLVLSQRHFRLVMQCQGVRLSRREEELVKLLHQGLEDGEIARRMGLRVNSVRKYIGRLRRKLGARSRAEIVLLAGQIERV